MMSKVQELYVFLSHLLTEPVCDIQIPWELPVPQWVLGAILVFDLVRGAVKNVKDFLWIITQLIIVSRMELLVAAMIVPYLVGKTSWCQSTEYLWGLATMFLRFAYMVMNVVSQLNYVSPECVRKLEALSRDRRNYD